MFIIRFSSETNSSDKFIFSDLSVLALVDVALFDPKLQVEKLAVYFSHDKYFIWQWADVKI